MESEKIELEMVDVETQRILSVSYNMLELTETKIWYRAKFSAEEREDETSLVWKEAQRYWDNVVWKDHIHGVFLSRLSNITAWQIEILSYGEIVMFMYFKKNSKAIEVRDKIIKWLLN